MEIDLQYLLFLQDLRNATGGMFDEIFNALSKVALVVLPYLSYVLLWAYSKEWGYRFLFSLNGGSLVNGTLQLTVCAYRPWIRSSLIKPAGDSKVAATGYSFPSGYTQIGTSLYGNIFVWQKNERKWLAILCVAAIFLTGFSRNFLGVHTPQDVVVGFLVGLISIWLGGKIAGLSGNERLLDLLTFLGFAFVVLSILYVSVKPYPMDYVEGTLLVDPQKMMNDHFKSTGTFTGLLLGSYLDRHFAHFQVPVGSRSLPILTCVGLGILISWKEYFAPATLVALLGAHWGNFIARFLMLFFAVYVWPWVIERNK